MLYSLAGGLCADDTDVRCELFVCEVFLVRFVLCVVRERRSSSEDWDEGEELEVPESASCSTSTKWVRGPVRVLGAREGLRETEVSVSCLAVLWCELGAGGIEGGGGGLVWTEGAGGAAGGSAGGGNATVEGLRSSTTRELE